MTSRVLAWALASAIVLAGARASAELGVDGSRITNNGYRIDLFQGPVLGGARSTGLSGAYSPVAEGVAGFTTNAASPAVRPLWSHSWFDFDWDLSVTFPSLLPRTDFDNNGRSSGFEFKNFVFGAGGLQLQFGNWGIGAAVSAQTYSLAGDTASSLNLQLGRTNLLLARSLLEGQLVIGIGTRVASLAITTNDGTSEKNIFKTSSAGYEAGVLVAPEKLPMRFAVTARNSMTPSNPQDSPALQRDGFDQFYVDGRQRWYLPQSVEVPWELETGFALQLGPRPLNQRWLNTHHPSEDYLEEIRLADGGVIRKKNVDYAQKKAHERYRQLPREKALMIASLLVSGPVPQAVGFESFLIGYVQRSGARVVVTPRVGVEAEPWANTVQLRAGSYLEPSRFAASTPRLHGTLGVEVRLFRWSVFGLLDDDTSWRIGAYADGAREYLSWGATAGIWH